MRVRELIALLSRVNPDSTVLFLDDYADLSDADEISSMIAPMQPWIHKRGRYRGEEYSVRYPDEFEPRDELNTDVTYCSERVVLMTNATTNYRRLRLSGESSE